MKKFFLLILAVIMLMVTAMTFTACKDDVFLTVSLDVYNIEEDETETKTLKFELYEELAPTAIKKVKELVKNGYYNDAVFYQNKSNTSLIMLGEYKLENDKLVKQEKVEISNAEFEKNGTTGSNLTNKKGALGLWRTWESDESFSVSGFQNSYSTLYIPTTSMSSYDGNFCVFGQLQTDAELATLDLIYNVLSNSDYYVSYTVYYYKNGEDFEFNSIKTSEYDEDSLSPYIAEDGEDTNYNPFEVLVSAEKVKINYIKIK